MKQTKTRKREGAVTLTQMKHVMKGILTEFKDEIKDEIGGIKNDIKSIQGDIVGIQGDIIGIKGDIVSIQGDIVDIKGDIHDIKKEQGRMNDKIFDLYATMQQDFVKKEEFEKLELRVETLEVI